MLGVQTTILIAAIPWVYSMHGRVTRIEASAVTVADLIDRVSSLESRLLRIEVELENSSPFHQKLQEHCYLDASPNAANMLKRGSSRQRRLNCPSWQEPKDEPAANDLSRVH